jgi:hypothetical protein
MITPASRLVAAGPYGHNGRRGCVAALANLIINMLDHLVRSLEGIAAAQHKTVEQLAIGQLRSLVKAAGEPPVGSAAALLWVMQQPPHPSASGVAELEAAIAAGRTG